MPRRYVFRHQTKPCVPCWVKAAIGTAVALGMVAIIDDFGGAPLLAAPLGASAVLVFGFPESPMAQPANVVGGYFIATLLALVVDRILPGGLLTMTGTVAGAMLVLALVRLVHPPAVAIPLVVMMGHPGWGFLLMPVLSGAVILILVAVLVHHLPPRSIYPLPIRPHPPSQT